MSTREKILWEALNQFSQRGFEAVSIRDIARAVGIKESSLYNHFTGKRDILDSVLQEYGNRWGAVFEQMQLTGGDHVFPVNAQAADAYHRMGSEQFMGMAQMLFEIYMTDDINVKVRRLLTIEQYRDPELGQLFRKISFEDSLTYQTQIFQTMMDAGFFVKGDPQMVAFAFFSPIFLLFYRCDGTEESLNEARALFTRHVQHFQHMYAISAQEKEQGI